MSAPPEAHLGAAELMLVSGYSGIGKSALVREIYRPITEKRGYFIAGKFDQFQRAVPTARSPTPSPTWSASLLTESAARLAEWKQRITLAVGPNGRVITDVIPDLELLIGPQPSVEKLGGTESQNRFNLVFQSFIQVFCRIEHPLVLFLDDLQWADIPSLKLLDVVMKDSRAHRLLWIGAYRDNEVDATHPLTTMVQGLREEGVSIHQIVLAPLDLANISHLIADALGEGREEVLPLASLTLQKTTATPSSSASS